ncbi:MAG TPA: NnrU family protein [Candidatus Acidoferrales bacterium]|nr:NnrU family protein [Candidatus Acidoferrales bacterium]
MTSLVLAAFFLPVSHFGISSSRLRDIVVRTLGEQPYRGLYSLVTLGAFAWLISAYRNAPTDLIWIAPAGLRLAMVIVVLAGFVLAVVGITTPNPTVIGAEKLFERPDIVHGVLRVTRNPFLWGVGLWALAHIVSTGDLASILMFGSIGALGLVGAVLIDAKKARRHGMRWKAFAALTSSVPFLAIAQRRQQLVVAELGWWRIALAVVLFLVALFGHRWAFGVSPLPRL